MLFYIKYGLSLFPDPEPFAILTDISLFAGKAAGLFDGQVHGSTIFKVSLVAFEQASCQFALQRSWSKAEHFFHGRGTVIDHPVPQDAKACRHRILTDGLFGLFIVQNARKNKHYSQYPHAPSQI